MQYIFIVINYCISTQYRMIRSSSMKPPCWAPTAGQHWQNPRECRSRFRFSQVEKWTWNEAQKRTTRRWKKDMEEVRRGINVMFANKFKNQNFEQWKINLIFKHAESKGMWIKVLGNPLWAPDCYCVFKYTLGRLNPTSTFKCLLHLKQFISVTHRHYICVLKFCLNFWEACYSKEKTTRYRLPSLF